MNNVNEIIKGKFQAYVAVYNDEKKNDSTVNSLSPFVSVGLQLSIMLFVLS